MTQVCRLSLVLALLILPACEEIITVKLDGSDPLLTVEAVICRDSVAVVRLTETAGYFAMEDPTPVDGAIVRIGDGAGEEELLYTGNGYYRGSIITGREGSTYNLKVERNGVASTAVSYMPGRPLILSINVFRDDTPGILNPEGRTVYSVSVDFTDNPEENNYYMIRLLKGGAMVENSYYLIDGLNANQGVVERVNESIIRFSESFFDDEGGVLDIFVYSIDSEVYNYFLDLNDILYWRHRFQPPTPYNPRSNISGGVLGYFAAWSFDKETVMLQ